MSKKNPQDENDVKDNVKDVLTSMKTWWYMPVQTGMGVGGIHDFIFCVPITVTQDMVGKTVGLFGSLETKRPLKVAELWRAAAKSTLRGHPSADKRFVSDNALQTYQYEQIKAAHGLSFVSDDAEVFRDTLINALAALQHSSC